MKLLLIDDHTLFREGIRLVLHRLDNVEEIYEAGTLDESCALAELNRDIDLVLLDLGIPGNHNTLGIKRIQTILPSAIIVIISAREDHLLVKQTIAAGAKGYIPKSSSSTTMIKAIRNIISGDNYIPEFALSSLGEFHINKTNMTIELTERQREVLQMVAIGKSNKEIANELGMAENTVRVHVAAILKVLKVENRTQAAFAGRQLGLVAEFIN